jgi:hypothetical protein
MVVFFKCLYKKKMKVQFSDGYKEEYYLSGELYSKGMYANGEKGGLGVMVDDLMAGVYAWLSLQLIHRFF